jgi:putative transposase
MVAGRKFDIKNHLSIDDLSKIVKDSKLHNKICIRVIFIKMLLQGSAIKEASKSVGVDRKTGYKWLKRYNKEGYEGLIPKFVMVDLES